MPRRLLVTGGSGLLGANMALAARDRYQVFASYLRHPIALSGIECFRLDLLDRRELRRQFERIVPDVVVHCAALTDLDLCQSNPELAHHVNVVTADHVAQICAVYGCSMVHISTDSVFDGRRPPYGEEDVPNPVNVYAESKLASERVVADRKTDSLILRVNLFGLNVQNKQNLAEWILFKLSAREKINGWTDVVFSPLLANDLANMIIQMLDHGLTGLYHVASRDACSKYDFACKLAHLTGLDSELIVPCSIHDLSLTTPRPLNTTLNVAKVERDLGQRMPTIDMGLRHFLALCQAGFDKELAAMRL